MKLGSSMPAGKMAKTAPRLTIFEVVQREVDEDGNPVPDGQVFVTWEVRDGQGNLLETFSTLAEAVHWVKHTAPSLGFA